MSFSDRLRRFIPGCRREGQGNGRIGDEQYAVPNPPNPGNPSGVRVYPSRTPPGTPAPPYAAVPNSMANHGIGVDMHMPTLTPPPRYSEVIGAPPNSAVSYANERTMSAPHSGHGLHNLSGRWTDDWLEGPSNMAHRLSRPHDDWRRSTILQGAETAVPGDSAQAGLDSPHSGTRTLAGSPMRADSPHYYAGDVSPLTPENAAFGEGVSSGVPLPYRPLPYRNSLDDRATVREPGHLQPPIPASAASSGPAASHVVPYEPGPAVDLSHITSNYRGRFGVAAESRNHLAEQIDRALTEMSDEGVKIVFYGTDRGRSKLFLTVVEHELLARIEVKTLEQHAFAQIVHKRYDGISVQDADWWMWHLYKNAAELAKDTIKSELDKMMKRVSELYNSSDRLPQRLDPSTQNNLFHAYLLRQAEYYDVDRFPPL